MPAVDVSLRSCIEALGGHPERFFVDEHESVYRIIENETGRVVGILRTDGTFGNYRIEPNPGAPSILATMAVVADEATLRS